jgi:uncharacterized coiled-coil DUF342 family protein
MEAESLSAACELAFSVARNGVEATPPIDPPTPMRSFLYVAQLPKRAMTVAQRVMDEDPEFRAQVARAASADYVGEIGYLWLTRPEGWEESIDLIEAAPEDTSDDDADSEANGDEANGDVADGTLPPPPPPGPAPTPPTLDVSGDLEQSEITSSDAIREELSSLQGLVTRLSEERRQVSTTVQPVEPSADGGISIQIEALRQDLANIRAERDRAQDQKELSIVRQAELADEIAELRRLIASLEEERAGIQATLAQAEEQVAGVQIVVSDLETQRDQVINERDGLTIERDELTLKRDALIAQTQALSHERDSLTGEVSDLSAQRDSLTFERDNLIGERDDLTGQLEQAGSNAEALELQIGDISGQAALLQREFEVLSVERAAVGAELERLNVDVAGTTSTRKTIVDSLAGQIAELNGERDVLANNLEQSQQTLAALRGAFNSATETLNSELDRVDVANSEVSATHVSLSSSLETTSERLEDLMAAPEPNSPNLTLLDSQLAEDAGQIHFVADIPAAPISSFTAATDGPSYSAPAAPVIGEAAGDDDSHEDSADSADMADSVADSATEASEPEIDPSSVFSGVANSQPDELDSVGAEIADELGDPVDEAAGDLSGDAIAEDAAAAAQETPEALVSSEHSSGRRSIDIPDSLEAGSEAAARHVVNTPDVVVLVHGDAVASMGWPAMNVAEQRGALVTYLNILAGDTGAAPDVMFDSEVGGDDSLPESRVVRIRLIDDSGSDTAQLGALIATYPQEWPVAVVTDDDVLAAEALAAGATVLNNGQLLDLFD